MSKIRDTQPPMALVTRDGIDCFTAIPVIEIITIRMIKLILLNNRC